MIDTVYYFSHDYNARNTPENLELMARYPEDGLKAYGCYWQLMETMAEDYNSAIDCQRLAGLAHRLHVHADWLIAFIETCIEVGLFFKEDNHVYSPKILKHKDRRAELIEKKSLAGKISAERRAAKINLTE